MLDNISYTVSAFDSTVSSCTYMGISLSCSIDKLTCVMFAQNYNKYLYLGRAGSFVGGVPHTLI